MTHGKQTLFTAKVVGGDGKKMASGLPGRIHQASGNTGTTRNGVQCQSKSMIGELMIATWSKTIVDGTSSELAGPARLSPASFIDSGIDLDDFPVAPRFSEKALLPAMVENALITAGASCVGSRWLLSHGWAR